MPPGDILNPDSPDGQSPSSLMMASAYAMERAVTNICSHLTDFSDALEIASDKVSRFTEALEKAIGAFGSSSGGLSGPGSGAAGGLTESAIDRMLSRQEESQRRAQEREVVARAEAFDRANAQYTAEHPSYIHGVMRGNLRQLDPATGLYDNPEMSQGVSGIGYNTFKSNAASFTEDSKTTNAIIGKMADEAVKHIAAQSVVGTNTSAVTGVAYAGWQALNELSSAGQKDLRGVASRQALSAGVPEESIGFGSNVLRMMRTRSSGRMFGGVSEDDAWAAQSSLAGTGALGYDEISRYTSPYVSEVDPSNLNKRGSLVEMMSYTGLSAQAVTGANVSGVQSFGSSGFEGSKDAMLERLAISKNLNVSQESLAKLSDSLIDSLRPVITGFSDVTPILQDFGEDLVRGRISIQGLTAVMGQAKGMGKASDELSDLILGGKDIAHLPGIGAAQAALASGEQPHEVGAMVRMAKGSWTPAQHIELQKILARSWRSRMGGLSIEGHAEMSSDMGSIGGVTGAGSAFGSPAGASGYYQALESATGVVTEMTPAMKTRQMEASSEYLTQQRTVNAEIMETAYKGIDALGGAATGASVAVANLRDVILGLASGSTTAPKPGDINPAYASPTGDASGPMQDPYAGAGPKI